MHWIFFRHKNFCHLIQFLGDTTGSEISNECRQNEAVNYNYLYADPNNDYANSPDAENKNGRTEKFVRPVRRVQSFMTERENVTKNKRERKKFNL